MTEEQKTWILNAYTKAIKSMSPVMNLRDYWQQIEGIGSFILFLTENEDDITRLTLSHEMAEIRTKAKLPK